MPSRIEELHEKFKEAENLLEENRKNHKKPYAMIVKNKVEGIIKLHP